MPDYEENFDDIFSPRLTRSDIRSEVERTLRDIGTFTSQAQAGVTNAILELKAAHPDFEERRSRMLTVLQEIPLLRDAVASAESNPQLSSALPQIYQAVYKASFAPADSTTAPASEPSKPETRRPSDLTEDAMYAGALASQRISLSPENRKNIISSLEQRGVLDVEF